MNKNEIAGMVAKINTIYGAKPDAVALAIMLQTYTEIFGRYEAAEVNAALTEYIRTEHYAPRPADILAIMQRLCFGTDDEIIKRLEAKIRQSVIQGHYDAETNTWFNDHDVFRTLNPLEREICPDIKSFYRFKALIPELKLKAVKTAKNAVMDYAALTGQSIKLLGGTQE